jgi:hypothetical protein
LPTVGGLSFILAVIGGKIFLDMIEGGRLKGLEYLKNNPLLQFLTHPKVAFATVVVVANGVFYILFE